MANCGGVGIDGFQIPVVYPNGEVHRPANGGIQQQINHPKHGVRTIVRMSKSNECPAYQTQMSGFVKNGKVDLNQAFNEVNRIASAMGCETFDCSFLEQNTDHQIQQLHRHHLRQQD